ncbi:MAG: hypothetical protein ACKOSQ_03035 [Planctomycetaceae bacterium]
MARPPFLVLGFVALVVCAPARGQGLLDAFVEGFVEGMNDAANDNGGFNNGGFNNGGWHDGHHHHHNHNGYVKPYPSNYYPSNSYVPAYPSQQVVSPAVVQNSLPYRGPGVTIVLEAEEGGSVTYVIDGRESATIQAGQEQKLPTKGKYEVRFSRGRSDAGIDFGQARYTITEGSYHFKATDKGWELFRDKEQPSVVTTQSVSPSGIKTNTLPSKPQPVKSAGTPAAVGPAANAVPAAGAALPPNSVPAKVPAAPAAG